MKLTKSNLDLKQCFLLDTGSNIKEGTAMNKDLVTDVRPADTPMLMDTNVGTAALTQQATVMGDGAGLDLYFDKSMQANIFSFAPTTKAGQRGTRTA